MSIFKDASDIVRSNVYDILEKAKDPGKMANLMVIDMEKELERARTELGNINGLRYANQKKIERNNTVIASAGDRAMKFLEVGNEAAAKATLTEKNTAERENAALAPVVAQLTPRCTELESIVNDIQFKLSEVRSMAATIQATGQVAKAMGRAAKVFDSSSSNSIYGQMDKMAMKADQQMGAAEASMGTYAPSAAASLAAAEVDSELEALKAQMSSGDK